MIAENDPKVSVVMSVYKEPVEWLHESIDSILNQTFSDFEFIIICDNPQYDGGISLLNEYARQDNRVKLLFNEVNIGLTKSLNKGLAIAKGKYIARMDADDISLPNRIEKQISILDNNSEIDVCGTCAELCGDRKGAMMMPEKDEDCCLFLDNCFIHSSVLMRKRVAELKYDEDCIAAQDYELWYRARKTLSSKFYNIQEKMIFYRCDKRQITQSKRTIQNSVASVVRKKALCELFKNQNISINFLNNRISYNLILNINNQLFLPDKTKQKLIFYLLLSVDSSCSETIGFLFRNWYTLRLPLRMTASIMYRTFTCRKIQLYK